MKNFLKPYGACPSEIQMNHYQMEKKAFFHFGMNTFTDAEWGDGSEREQLFNPVGCDTRQWIRSVKAAGFRLAIITAKHHDGFCLWQSKYTEHGIKNSPYKDGHGDIVREFVDACHEYDVKVGIYVSPWDRNSPYWGKREYSLHFAKQLEELLTNYGRIDEVWWDGAGSRDTPYDWELWAKTVKTLQPEAAIFGSQGATPFVDLRWVGNEGGFAGNPCFATIDNHVLEGEDTSALNSGIPDGERFIPAEVDVSIRPGWFFHEEQEDEVRSVASLVHLWFDSVGSNANMLLNFPPDRTGLLREKDISHAAEAHRIIENARKNNLAKDAVIMSDVPAEKGYPFEAILDSSRKTFFAPTGKAVTLTLRLKAPTRVNMFEISEAIEYGHRIRGFRVEALVDGAYKTVFDGKCIGYKWAEFFDEVTTDCVRIVIYNAKDVPLLTYFGLYLLDTSVFEREEKVKRGVDLVKGKYAKINLTETEAEVEFGGIYPFNTVTFSGSGIEHYEIYAFDGSNYNLIYSGRKPHRNQIVTLKETVEASYKMKLVARKHYQPIHWDIGVFCL